MNTITVSTLACGMPVIFERMGAVRSASMSWLLPIGAATDKDNLEGLSALIEEMLSRGAGERSSREHADAADRLGVSRGVDVGTFTTRLSTVGVGRDLPRSLDLFTDMVLQPRFDEEALTAAKDLAIQDIESLKDDPQERAFINARERHHPRPLNRSGMGTKEGISAVTRGALIHEWTTYARPGGAVIAFAGDIDRNAVTDRLNDLLRDWRGAAPPPVIDTHAPRGYGHEPEESNQVQIVVMYDAPPEPAPTALLERLAVSVLSGGMSGRLFSEVREKRGLCYSVSASYRGDKAFGVVTAYVGTTPERAQDSLDVLLEQLRRVTTPEGAVTREEFERARTGIKAGLVFAGESSAARAAALAADWRRLGRPRSLDEIAAEVDAVTLEQLNDYLAQRRLGTMTIQTLGKNPLRAPVS
ncbi:MAG TPA: pitrilysin family protein [Phycisphaerales bacterium]|nr:pitrilysin family protein [Phycisphaerales bacterium]